MKLSKLIKASTCVIGLSIVISGMSAFATEKENITSEIQTEDISRNERRKDELYNKFISEGKSDCYAKYCSYLMVDRDLNDYEARKLAAVYEKEVKGKGELYADYYAILIVKRHIKESIARSQAELYCKEIESGRNNYYADCYAICIVHKEFNDNEARIYAEDHNKKAESDRVKFYKYCQDEKIYMNSGLPEELVSLKLYIYKQKLKEGKSTDYAEYYADANVKGNIDWKSLDNQAKIYESKIKQGKSCMFSRAYAKLSYILEIDKEKLEAKINRCCEEIKINGIEKDQENNYSGYYIDLRILKGIKREQAKRLAETYINKLNECGDYVLADYYATLIGRGMAEYEAEILSNTYMEEIKSGKSEIYAEYYTTSNCMDRKIREQEASVYERLIKKGRNKKYASKCAALVKEYLAKSKKNLEIYKDIKTADLFAELNVKMGMNEEEARHQIERYKQEMLNGSEEIYARYYIILTGVRGLSEKEARIQTNIYIRQVKLGKDCYYADYYATSKMKGNLNESQIKEGSEVYSKEMEFGENEEYVKYYVDNLLSNKKLPESLVRHKADIFVEKILEGKSNCYANCYAILSYNCNIDKKMMAEGATTYDLMRKKGKSHEYSILYTYMKAKGISDDKVNDFMNVYEREISAGKSELYAKCYAIFRSLKGLDEEEATSKAKICIQDLSDDRSNIYLDYYINQLMKNRFDEEKVKLRTRIYEREIIKGHSNIYSDYYAKLVANEGEKEYRAECIAKEYENRISSNGKYYAKFCSYFYGAGYFSEKFLKRSADIYEKKRISGKSHEYAWYCAKHAKEDEAKVTEKAEIYQKCILEGRNDYYSDRYAYLIVDEKLDEKTAMEESRIYSETMVRIENTDEGSYYAEHYAYLIAEREYSEDKADRSARKYEQILLQQDFSEAFAECHVYLTEELKFRSRDASKVSAFYEKIRKRWPTRSCAMYLIELIYKVGLSEQMARTYTEIYYKERSINKSDEYSRFYIELLIKGIEAERAKSYYYIYTKERNDGRSKEYAERYIELLQEKDLSEDKIRKELELYETGLLEGKEKEYMKAYAGFVVEEGMNEEKAECVSMIYNMEIGKGKSREYAYHYSLLLYDGIGQEEAEKRACIYEYEVGYEQKGNSYASYYAELVVCEGLDKSIANARAELYSKQMDLGKGQLYSNYFTELVIGRGINEEIASKQTEIYISKLREGKCQAYADCYAILKAEEPDMSEERADKVARIYNQRIIAGEQDYVAFYYANACASNVRITDSHIKTYKELMKKFKNHAYAEYCTHLIVDEKMYQEEAEARARIYLEILRSGYKCEQADYYSFLVFNKRVDAFKAMVMSMHYTKMTKEGKDFHYAYCYSSLAENQEIISKESLEEISNIYSIKRREGKSLAYSLAYACLSDMKRLDKDEIDRIALENEKYLIGKDLEQIVEYIYRLPEVKDICCKKARYN